ncbi:MAG: DUF3011 domain-containing protein [Candidatus Competibacter sp.]|nr:DUF3011 domain-containing protein [Candidatus Competibacter sp.]MDG4584802.1 DUF3011 domain-containing protein [Candidatus Competibacter sp.]
MNSTNPDTTDRFIRAPRRQQPGALLLMAVFLLALASPAPGDAQPYSGGRYNDDRRSDGDRYGGEQGRRRGGHDATVRCESTDQGYRYCRADTRDGVQLYRQLSKNACRYNDTWGYDRRGVWVDRGCRGDFQLYTGASGGDGNRKDKNNTAAIVGGVIALGVLGAVLAERNKENGPDHPYRTLRCESDGDYRHCRADTQDGVQIYRQLSKSACRYNDTWGYDRRGVWVDRGCRAEFSLN